MKTPLSEALKALVSAMRREPPVNSDERAFVESYSLDASIRISTFALAMGFCLWAFALATTALLADDGPELRRACFSVFGANLALAVAGSLGARHLKGRSLPILTLFLQLLTVAGLTWLGAAALQYIAVPTKQLFAPSSFAVMGLGCLVFSPLGNWTSIGAAVVYSVMGIIAHYENDPGYAGILCVLYGLGLILNLVAANRIRTQGLREFRARAMFAPAPVVRRSIAMGSTIDAAFAPRMRACAFISTDLRRFSEMMNLRQGSNLGEYLAQTYDRTQAILRRHAPAGNYYVDWIAGELFIILFEDEGAPAQSLAGTAVAVARAFLSDDDGAFAADIGLSFGSALVGMMGPLGMRKATALGDVPGRARRMQGGGSIPRQQLGVTDEVFLLFGSDVFMALGAAVASVPLTEVNVSPELALRDLVDRTVYCVGNSINRSGARHVAA